MHHNGNVVKAYRYAQQRRFVDHIRTEPSRLALKRKSLSAEKHKEVTEAECPTSRVCR